jgi:cytochrome c biogenesis protein CcmG/thiol:disulfide interchange protein DsbE
VSREGGAGTSGETGGELPRGSAVTSGGSAGAMPRSRYRRLMSARCLAPPVALLLAATAVACTAETTPTVPKQRSPFAGCEMLTSTPSGPAPGAPDSASGAPTTAGAPADLPDLVLPCFSGGNPVQLADLRGPAVINLWASWCDPCREELPAMQRLADRTAGRLHVVGVDTGDARDAAASFGTDNGVTLPTLYDRDRKLARALGRAALPVTVFVGADGKRYVYDRLPPDDAQLAELVRDHAGVAVAP